MRSGFNALSYLLSEHAVIKIFKISKDALHMDCMGPTSYRSPSSIIAPDVANLEETPLINHPISLPLHICCTNEALNLPHEDERKDLCPYSLSTTLLFPSRSY